MWLKDIVIPLVTFIIGILIEHFRQVRRAKQEKLEHIDEKFRNFIQLVNEEKRNISLLKYEYNSIHFSIKSFCLENGLDIDFLNNDLIELNINSTSHNMINPEKVSNYAILIINKIKKI